MATQKPKFFRSQDAFRKWLGRHHATKDELLVGYYKVDTDRPSMTSLPPSAYRKGSTE